MYLTHGVRIAFSEQIRDLFSVRDFGFPRYPLLKNQPKLFPTGMFSGYAPVWTVDGYLDTRQCDER